LVKVEACAFCSSTDVKIAYGELPFVSSYPCILGHEGVGTIIELDAKVRHLAVGDRVLRPPAVYPGEKLGEFFSGWGGFAEYACVIDWQSAVEDLQMRADQVGLWPRLHQKVPADMDAPGATMLITLKETLSSLQDMGLRPATRVLVIGDGAVGLGFAYWAKILGATRVIVAGHHEDRLQRALKFGVDATINSRGKSLPEALAAGEETSESEHFDFIIDAVGSARAIEQSVPLLMSGGVLAIYGVSSHLEATVDILRLPVGARILRASTDEPRVHQQVLDAWRLGLLKLEDFYSHILPLAEAPRGIELLRTREAFKVVCTME
ncbi:MAG: zinc-binding dehydrogenase, partial [Armatimonadota bacterium]